MLGSAGTADHPDGLPDGMITIDCEGSGGMSFGAFLPHGITLNIAGEANDYFGKGLSGGVLSVAPAKSANFRPEENIVVGNVAFYGATSGRGFVNGLAGQRFAVRNSGAKLVVEGIGNNGCEYMTGGTVLILGEVGLNFAAGMSGGIAYVYDAEHTLAAHCNQDMVDIVPLNDADLKLVKNMIEEHVDRTASPLGVMLLYRFDDTAGNFLKVVPREYARMMQLTEEAERAGATHEGAVEIAFEAMRG
jgi:glutamate synthase (ferredoxin)